MSLIRRYVRELLIEKTFSDLGVKKGQWVDVPEQDLAVHTPDIDIDDDIAAWYLIMTHHTDVLDTYCYSD